MGPITIICRTVMPGDGTEVPCDDLSRLFSTVGVDLEFETGNPIEFDPAYDDLTPYDSLVTELSGAGQPGAPAYLLLGMRHPSFPQEIAGQLLDLRRRGVAAVFRYSDYIRSGGPTALLQTCAHEIGHMLNLGHRDVSNQYASVMNQADGRIEATVISWSRAAQEVQSHQVQGISDWLQTPAQPMACHPFAFPARHHLIQDTPQSVLPWQSRFDRGDDGANDRWSMGTGLKITPEASRLVEGGVFPFHVEVRAPQDQSIPVPPVFGPEFENMILTVIRPDGTRYQHRPRSLVCLGGREMLAPGERMGRSFCTIRGPGGAVFPQAGRYQIEVALPAQGISSPRIELQVEPRTGGPLTEATNRILVAKAMRGGTKVREVLTRLVADEPGIEPHTRCYLALVAALVAPRTPGAADLRAVALSAEAPSEVRHAAVLAEARAQFGRGILTKDAVEELAKRHVRDGEKHLLTALKGGFLHEEK